MQLIESVLVENDRPQDIMCVVYDEAFVCSRVEDGEGVEQYSRAAYTPLRRRGIRWTSWVGGRLTVFQKLKDK